MRPSWDEYFMDVARTVATRSTCDRKAVGAVIVRNRQILSTGYNGSVRDTEHCDDVGHLMENGHCVRTVHAEANAIVQAARNGVSIDGAVMYITACPCFICFKMLVNAGIKDILYEEYYGRDEKVQALALRTGVGLLYVGNE